MAAERHCRFEWIHGRRFICWANVCSRQRTRRIAGVAHPIVYRIGIARAECSILSSHFLPTFDRMVIVLYAICVDRPIIILIRLKQVDFEVRSADDVLGIFP